MQKAIKLMAGVVMISALSACAMSSSDAQKKVVLDALVACMDQAANRIDDHRSDALSVAIAIQPMCLKEENNAAETFGVGLSLASYHDFERRMATQDIELGTTIVMHERSK